MNLSTAMTIEAGGQGSGCNPQVGHCGRPEHYHGTTVSNAKNILKSGFDSRRLVYATPNKDEAKSFAYGKTDRDDYAIVVLKDIEKNGFTPDKQQHRENRNWVVSRRGAGPSAIDRIEVYKGGQLVKTIKAGGPGSGCHGENCGRPAENLVKDADKSSWRNPIDGRERIVNNNAAIEIRVTGENKISLQAIRSFEKGKGHGTKALEWLLKLADKHGVTIEADVHPFMTKDKGLNKKNLMAWYKRHGFEKKMGDWFERKPKS